MLVVRLLLPFLLVSAVVDAAGFVFRLSCDDHSSRRVVLVVPGYADLHRLSSEVEVRQFSPGLLPHRGVAALPGVVRLSDDASLGVWTHELVHQYQMEVLGVPGFHVRYLTEYLHARVSGCSAYDAYMAMPLERAAHSSELMLPRRVASDPFVSRRAGAEALLAAEEAAVRRSVRVSSPWSY